MRVTAARLNCVPVRSHKMSTDLRGCVVTMRGTSPTIVVTSSALHSVRSTRIIFLPLWVIKRTRSIWAPPASCVQNIPQRRFPGESVSSCGQEALYRLSPLSARGVTRGDFTGPGTRQVPRGAHQEGELLTRVRSPNLLVEFERFRRGVSANVEHHEIVDMGLPQKACCGEFLGFMHLDSVTPQDGSAYLAGCLAAVDEENFPVSKSRTAAQWRWAIHTTLPKRARPLWEGDSKESLRREEAGVNRNIKSPEASRLFGCSGSLYWRLGSMFWYETEIAW